MRFLLVLFFLLFAPFPAHAQQAGIVGLWATEDKDGIIEIYVCEDGEYCGRFYWLKDDSEAEPSLDDRNPDPELKKRPLCGLTFLGGFTKNDDEQYEGGWIYSIRHGTMFSARLTLRDPDTLVLRGFVLIPFLGGEQVWTRVKEAPACHLIVNKPS